MFRCPFHYMLENPWTRDVVAITGDWQEGILPYPGGTQDQPYLLTEAVRVVRDEIWMIREEERKEAERKRKHGRSQNV